MFNSINKTVIASVAALTIGFTALGAVSASADVSSYRTGQTESPFAMGDVSVGHYGYSPSAGAFTAMYQPSVGSFNSCAPVVTRHQRTDTVEYPIGCN